ncbi:MAG: nicotinate phosphoribosyltransferase [Wenzhouxiangellaceae bacterium]|nr:nicotinate phosphoribosyltransferase [Wenzhouxiangellaceae bacterium]
MNSSYLTGTNAGLFTDLYELTMAQAFVANGMLAPATFSLFYRSLPDNRNYVLSCGIEAVVDFLAEMRFGDDDLAYLKSTGKFSSAFLDYLAGFRFTGQVMAVPDGTPTFPSEPLVEVTAPLPEAQIMETWVINQMHVQSVLASKAARIVAAAAGRPVLDFGLRRVHGADNGLKAARAFHVAGVEATSNVLAGRVYGIPVSGTMAHSYIQAHDNEMDAFRSFTREFPETVLLVDTFDTIKGVENVVALADELGDRFKVTGIRIDSGDLAELARRSRKILDQAGLNRVEIFVSGGLDEFGIAEMLADEAPIDGFGVGTAMGVAPDAPDLDIAYKLVEYDGRGRMKLSTGKPSIPGAKQVYRHKHNDIARVDVLARRDERLDGTPLLEAFMENGKRVRDRESADQARQRAGERLAELSDELRGLDKAPEPYSVTLSEALKKFQQQTRERTERTAQPSGDRIN